MKGNIHLIGCGGAGTNIVADIFPKLTNLGDEFSDFTANFIDTTDKTIQAHVGYEDKFFRVVNSSSTGSGMDGLSGERKAGQAVGYINDSVREFIDKGKFKNGKNDYYVIVSSGSGGSGSLISPLLLKAMLEKDFTVIVVVIGDSSNFLGLNNTINTLTSLQGVSVAAKKAVSSIYYNNTFNGVTSPKTERDVNGKVFKMLSICSLFVSGTIQNIDNQDMQNFFRPDKYSSFRVAPGIYSLGVANGEVNDESCMLIRSIITEGEEDMNINITPLHNKVGVVMRENDHLATFPLFLLQRKGIIGVEVVYLKEELEKIEKMKNSKYDAFDALDSADVDEFGLAL